MKTNNLKSQPFIHRFGDSYDEFIQVLVDEFVLSRHENGKCLQFRVENNTMAIRDPKARHQLNDFLVDRFKEGKKNPIINQLRKFEEDPHILSYNFNSISFPFRYANGGVLPIMKINGHDYFCLFYRAVFPVGWNIANGAANNMDDIRNPLRIVYREFSEEFIIADHENMILYIFDVDNEYTMSGTQETALKLWNKKLVKYDLSKYKRKSIPLKWIEGNDILKLKYEKEQYVHDGFWVNITPEDNAIEIDKIALINLKGEFSLYDGEVGFIRKENGHSEGFILDRIIGLFPVKKFLSNLHLNRFEPEFFYYCGERYSVKEFDRILKSQYLKRHFKSDFRTEKQHAKYLESVELKTDLDLCPITRAVAKKYQDWLKDEKNQIDSLIVKSEQKPKTIGRSDCFDIFISFKSKDQAIAELLYDFLMKNNYNVFCSSKSIKFLGTSEYSKAIDSALEQSVCLVLIGSDIECFESGWVDYEWRTFQMLLLSQHKKGELFTLTQNINPIDLPVGLRSRENIQITGHSLDVSFRNLLGYIQNAMEKQK
ncbi:MAG: toll/interleukin-1 receptor domain-containing protein [Bacteroidetes bacterium]|nr:toll/interleukin-1 receptor domain-containing protein [Bacteroidota bacterium]